MLRVNTQGITEGIVDNNHIFHSDSGGPLTVIGPNDVPIQVGIVSFGSSAGCEKGFVSDKNFPIFSRPIILIFSATSVHSSQQLHSLD